ncbi:MAG: FAD-dependent oxidoreductase, partial [Candidatus Puniceispirillaceae bacterium]
MKQIETDICIIGGGSGGLSLASGAVQMGARVVLFEGGQMGGDCLNSGCVPSKALLAAAKAAHHAHGAPRMGVMGTPPQIDFPAV